MNPTYKNYTLVQQPVGFDLFETITRQKKGTGTISKPNGKLYQKEENIGYNMSMDGCLNTIIHLELLKLQSTVELQEFRKEWKKLSDEIKEALKVV